MRKDIQNIAHRGARSVTPENTLFAAKKAYDLGADAWELDCGVLKDGTLIVLHDDNFKRTTNIDQVFPERKTDHLSTFLWEEVQQLDAGSSYIDTDPFGQIQEGNVSAADIASFRGAPIPLLEEALSFTKDHHWQVNVEIKNMKGTPWDASIAESVVKMIRSMGMENQVLISSFNHRYLRQCHSAAPGIKTAALVGIQKPWDLKKTLSLGCYAYHPPVYSITGGHIRRARKLGLDVNIWTVNEQKRMVSLIEAGVSGIITDFPQRLREILQEI
ncbi:MAG: glycerophosphodiester phosphodiesterase [Anaerolineae bacterium]|nr:glycerophosphodiester phosphodiesterase [Anaerolineae bacterium]